MTRNKEATRLPVEHIARSILILRGYRVLLDSQLAALYETPTKRLNEQVRRNIRRFPDDFMFRLTPAEVQTLNRSQIATGSQKHRDPRYPPYAFTEHGAIMAATVLNSPRAIKTSVYVVRAFVQLRDLLASNRQLAEKFAELERKVSSHDQAIVGILKAIRELMNPPEPKSGRSDSSSWRKRSSRECDHSSPLQQLIHAIPVRAAEFDLLTVIQRQEVLAVRVRTQAAHTLDVHDR